MKNTANSIVDKRLEENLQEFVELQKQTLQRFSLNESDFHLCLDDATTGSAFDRHYVYHTAWAARYLQQCKVEKHIDISSLIYFSTMLSAFIPVDYYEYRPDQLNLSQFSIGSADLKSLPFESNSISSLSCMHVVEHIGLGRYGEAIDPDGDLKAMSELKRVVCPDGLLLFVVPSGRESKICFNAHRIYTFKQVLSYFTEFELERTALITDNPKDTSFIEDAVEDDFNRQIYGCGCFAFRKKPNS